MSVLDVIAPVMDSYGLPSYIYGPIARQESGLNPLAHNTAGEDSRGLYQINVQANPQYAGLNLYDPVTNATVAGRDFLLPAYRQISQVSSDPGVQASYVWKEGIRPNWENVVSQGKDVALMTDARQVAGSVLAPNPVAGGNAGPGTGGDPWYERVLKQAGLFIVFIVIFLVAVLGAGKAFGIEAPTGLAGKVLGGGK